MKPKSQEIALRTRPSRTDYSLSRPPGTDRVCRTSPAVSQRRIRQHHKRGPGVASMTYSSNMRRGISGRGHAHTHEPEFSGVSPHSPIPTWARASCPGRGRPRGRVSGAAVGGVPRPPRSGDDERGEKIRPILTGLALLRRCSSFKDRSSAAGRTGSGCPAPSCDTCRALVLGRHCRRTWLLPRQSSTAVA